MNLINFVTKVGAENELLFNKPASEQKLVLSCTLRHDFTTVIATNRTAHIRHTYERKTSLKLPQMSNSGVEKMNYIYI